MLGTELTGDLRLRLSWLRGLQQDVLLDLETHPDMLYMLNKKLPMKQCGFQEHSQTH